MGAEFQMEICERDDVKVFGEEVMEQARYDHGHGGYSGTFAECHGVTITGKEFASLTDAQEYLEENCEKWENILAVKLIDPAHPEAKWMIGAWCSS
jgi:hypothetical protein